MKMRASAPASRAAQATAWPWLPALAVTTPAACSSGAQLGDLVDRAADLEGAGALEVLRLQVDGAPGQPRERLRAVDRSDARDACDPPLRGLDLFEARGGFRRQRGTPSGVFPAPLSRGRASGPGRRRGRGAARGRPRPHARGASSPGRTRRRTPRRPDSSAAAPRAAPRSRGAHGAPRSSPRARGRSRPGAASVSTIGGRHDRSRSSERIERTSFSIVFAAG